MRSYLVSLMLCASAVQADVPRVATDIAPVHALVAMVMDGVGDPDLIIPPAASPHSYAMRPSEARALASADLVVWIGPALTPWLAEPIETLANGAIPLPLQDVPGTHQLRNRDGVAFEGHDHDHEAPGEAGEELGSNDLAPDAGKIDPHLWLDPANGALWLGAIADALAGLDPENAARYRANADKGQADIAQLQVTLDAQLAPLQDRPFIVFHDAFHYFEARFGVEARAAIALSDGAAPSAARLAQVRDVVAQTGALCIFTEPQFNGGLIDALNGDVPLKSAALDPLGASLPLGPALYPTMLTDMAAAFSACLKD